MRQARPGNALDAASSRRMSHRRYGKPVRLDYKAPARSLCLSALSAGVFSATLSSSRSSVPRPSASPPSLQAVSTFLPVPRLSPAFSLPLIRVSSFLFSHRDTRRTKGEILNRHFVAPRTRFVAYQPRVLRDDHDSRKNVVRRRYFIFRNETKSRRVLARVRLLK